MADRKEKKIYNKLRNKYRLIVYNDTTFEEVRSFKLTRMNVFSIAGTLIILLIALVTILIAFTPLREFIPGYPDGNMQKNILLNAIKTDSLEHQLAIKDQYFNNLKTIIEGRTPVSIVNKSDTNTQVSPVEFTRSREDSLLRVKIEEEQLYNINPFDASTANAEYYRLLFYPPVKGVITSKFDPSLNHFGTDIVASENEMIHAAMDGTVILTSWTLDTGYLIEIHHANNFVSFYKHISQKLVETGTKVKAGDPIAIIGDSGELSTGAHLHFEIWHNGTPLNPEDYISF